MPSSVIRAMRFYPQQRAVLIVFRASGETYVYFDVSPEEWREFLASGSKGTYLNHTFKTRHEYVKVNHLPAALQQVQLPAQSSGRGEPQAGRLEWGETSALPQPAPPES